MIFRSAFLRMFQLTVFPSTARQTRSWGNSVLVVDEKTSPMGAEAFSTDVKAFPKMIVPAVSDL